MATDWDFPRTILFDNSSLQLLGVLAMAAQRELFNVSPLDMDRNLYRSRLGKALKVNVNITMVKATKTTKRIAHCRRGIQAIPQYNTAHHCVTGTLEVGTTEPYLNLLVKMEFSDVKEALTLRTPAEILLFWFGEALLCTPNNIEEINKRISFWFGKAPQYFVDTQMNSHALLTAIATSDNTSADSSATNADDSREGLSQAHVDISDGRWTEPLGILAQIIVLDQFPRTMFRGTPRAFAYDSQASKLACFAVSNGWCESVYSPVQRVFIGICLQHAEDLSCQERGVQLALSLDKHCHGSDEIAAYFLAWKGYPYEHFDVIQRFGRFPSRNPALGRANTPEEEAWLSSPDLPAWAKSQLPATASASSDAGAPKPGGEAGEAGEGEGGDRA